MPEERKTGRIAVLFNPSAGKGRAEGRRRALEIALGRMGVPFDLFVTESEENLRELTRTLPGTYQVLAGAGGDSTFHIMANELMGSGAAASLGMIGLGSSNDIPLEFGLETMEKSCRALSEGRTRRIDLGCILMEGQPARYFLGQANLGLGAAVNRYVEDLASRRPRLARQQTLSGILGVLDAYRTRKIPVRLRIVPEKGQVEGEFAAAVFGNTRCWATGKLINPQAVPDDGFLDACLIGACSFPKLARLAILAAKGRHGKAGNVRFLRAGAFEITSPRGLEVQADGEILHSPGPADSPAKIIISCLPRVLSVIA